MKPPPKPGPPRGASSGQQLLAVARERNLQIEQAEARNRRTTWLAMILGGLGLAGVFVYLDGQPATPKDSATVEARLLRQQSQKPRASEGLPPVTAQPKVDEGVVAGAGSAASAAEPQVAATPGETPGATLPDEAELLAKEPVLVLAGTEALRDPALQRDRALIKRAIEGKAWAAYRDLLARSLREAMAGIPQGGGLNRFDALWSEPVFYQALLRWRTLGFFPEAQITPLVTDAYTGEMLRWMLNRNEAMEELLLTVKPQDDPGAVLKFLTDAWAVNTERYEKYFSLAVACAVVFDRPMSIPNPVGKSEYGVEQTVESMKRYLWYVDKNEKGKLAAPVHRSTARDLVWAVCAPVTTSELEWSIDKMHYRRRNWGDAYGSVEYLMERAVNGLNPYKEYSFAEILKEGGICGDQSYFCVNTARAQGIPAMTIAGETDLGGHAWAGLKTDDDEWTTQVGRIGGASKGTASNPQTGGSITEQEIQQWNDRHHRSPATTISVWRHLWLADFQEATGNDAGHAEAVRLAHRIGTGFTETWRALYTLLEKETRMTGEPAAPENLDDWKEFASDMRREFKDNPRMAELAANAELEYIFPFGEAGDAKRALMRERRRIERDSGEQKDLIASSLQREAALIAKRADPDAKRQISHLYDRALRDYGGSVTGFKMMAEDYFGHMREDPELARKAARDIELAFKRVVESGTKDWFRANTEAGIHRMICGYYRAAGDPERAEMLEKRVEVLLKRSKRGAL